MIIIKRLLAFLIAFVWTASLAQLSPGSQLANAAAEGNTALVKRLIAQGAETNSASPLRGTGSGDQGNPPLSLPPLAWAAMNGHLETAQALIASGAEVNAAGSRNLTPINVAAGSGHADLVALLAKQGADVNAADEKGMTPLAMAALLGFSDTASVLIAHSADPNLVSTVKMEAAITFDDEDKIRTPGEPAEVTHPAEISFSGTPLVLALLSGHPRVAEVLLSSRLVDIEASAGGGERPLHLAAMQGNAGLVSKLLARGAQVDSPTNNGETPLYAAASYGHAEVIKVLAEAGAKLDAPIPLTPNEPSGSQTSPCYSGAPVYGSALYIAAKFGYPEAVRALLQAGASPNRVLSPDGADNDRIPGPLGVAVANPVSTRNQIVELLLEHSADPNELSPHEVSELPGHHGKACLAGPPINDAATSGDLKLVQDLLAAGADPNQRTQAYPPETYSLTPMHLVSSGEHPEIIEVLLSAGADANGTDASGMTALHWAAYASALEAARLLIEHGADPELKDKEGKTPLGYARESGNPELVALLEKATAKRN